MTPTTAPSPVCQPVPMLAGSSQRVMDTSSALLTMRTGHRRLPPKRSKPPTPTTWHSATGTCPPTFQSVMSSRGTRAPRWEYRRTGLPAWSRFPSTQTAAPERSPLTMWPSRRPPTAARSCIETGAGTQTAIEGGYREAAMRSMRRCNDSHSVMWRMASDLAVP